MHFDYNISKNGKTTVDMKAVTVTEMGLIVITIAINMEHP